MDILKGLWNAATGIWDNVSKPLGGLWNWFSGERTRNDSIQTQGDVFRREDTAIQRRMEDMKRAGINPILAAGSPAQTSSPVIAKGGDIDPTDFLAPLQAKLLAEQIGVTTAQKELSLAQLPGVKAESSYKQYENASLQQSGQLKTDTGIVKNLKEAKKFFNPLKSDPTKQLSEYKKGFKIELPKLSNVTDNLKRLVNFFQRK